MKRRLRWSGIAQALVLCGALSACGASAAGSLRPQAVSGLRESFQVAPEFGGRVYVQEGGRAGMPPVVLIHGLGEDAARVFEPLLPALSRHHHVLVFDLPGFGRSSGGHGDYSPPRYARFVQAMIARNFREPAVVVGHSMGAAIAIELAGTYPESVRRLALFDVPGVLHYKDYLRAIVRAEMPDDRPFVTARKVVRKALFEFAWWPFTHAKLEDFAKARGRGRSPSRSAALLMVQHDFGPALRRVRAPSFVGWGKRDTVAPLRTAHALRYMLSARSVHVFERSAHVPMRTEPAEVVRALRAFLDEQPAVTAVSQKPFEPTRIGICDGEHDRVLEGDYVRIDVRRCKRLTLRNVRTHSLNIDRSEVELIAVDVLTAQEVAVRIRRSDVRWTGGRLDAQTCLEAARSGINLFAVSCAFRQKSFRLHGSSKLFASASVLRRDDVDVPLHGSYESPESESYARVTLASLDRSCAHAATCWSDLHDVRETSSRFDDGLVAFSFVGGHP